jgi:circadian clock protein KaiB
MNQITRRDEEGTWITEQLERPLWRLRLYVAGHGPHSVAAIVNLKKICSEQLNGRYYIEIVDLLKNGAWAEIHPVAATPTLICILPGPIKDCETLSSLKRMLDFLDWDLFHGVQLKPGGRQN